MAEKVIKPNMVKGMLEKISPENDDVIILKGTWEQDQMQTLASLMTAKNMTNILVCIPDDQSLEVMPIADFRFMLKEVEKRMGCSGEDE